MDAKGPIGMVLIVMFFQVSFGSESLLLPVAYSSFNNRHPGFFFHISRKVSHLITFILRKFSLSLYKTEWKVELKAQKEGGIYHA